MKNYESPVVLQTFILYLAACGLDFLTSLHGLESNPFARHADMTFWPAHALWNMLAGTAGFAFLSGGLHVAGRVVHRQWGRFLACLPWLYFGFNHLEAALWNIQIRAGLYQESFADIYRRLMGQ
jgi:hypothetical protein